MRPIHILTSFIENLGLRSHADPQEISLHPLKGGRSQGRIFKFDILSNSYVLRLPPPQAIETVKSHQTLIAKLAGEIGVGPKVLFIAPNLEGIILAHLPGRIVTPEDFKNTRNIANFTRVLQKLHWSSLEFPLAASPFRRFESFIEKAQSQEVFLPSQFALAKKSMKEIEQSLELQATSLAPNHLDLNLSNIMLVNDQFYLVDWVNGGLSDPYFDLATFAFFANLDKVQTTEFLTTYLGHLPTEDEWKRFNRITPVRLFVIAASCFATAPQGREEGFYERRFTNVPPFHSLKRDTPHWQLGLSLFKAGLEVIKDS